MVWSRWTQLYCEHKSPWEMTETTFAIFGLSVLHWFYPIARYAVRSELRAPLPVSERMGDVRAQMNRAARWTHWAEDASSRKEPAQSIGKLIRTSQP
jgi:hypothetical protein